MLELFLNHSFAVFGVLLGIVLVGRILRQSKRPSVSFAWMLAIIFVPYLGVPAYLLFGDRKIRLLASCCTMNYSLAPERADNHPSLLASVVDNVLTASGMSSARSGLNFEYLPDGEAYYAKLLDLIDGADRSIHIMTFILGRDTVGRAIVSALARKAEEGVEVRLLLDAWGSWRTCRGFVQELRDAGGSVGVFMPFLPIQRRWSLNLRNHRKMLVVDGKTALIGGMNLADEYLGGSAKRSRWIDTGAVVRGAVALDLEDVFLDDWEFATGHRVEALSDDIDAGRLSAGDAVGQVVASGPNVDGDPLYEAILTATYEAKKRIWIVTPYFVPDEGLVRALKLQARLGCDVRIVVPKVSNHYFADLARSRFLRELKEAGATILAYSGRMMHAKHLVFDDRIAVVGSINFDMRSLYLNYEIALFLYTHTEIGTVAAWMDSLMQECSELRERPPGHVRKLAEDLSLLVSPLL